MQTDEAGESPNTKCAYFRKQELGVSMYCVSVLLICSLWELCSNVMNMFNVALTVHRDTSMQHEPTGCTKYFQFVSIISLYLFRAVLLPIIRMYCCLYTAVGVCHVFMLTGCWQDPANSEST